MDKKSAMITGVSSFLPPKVITNEDLSKTIDTNDDWIFPRTGIKSRHVSEKPTSFMATESAKKLLKQTNTDPSTIDAIIVATTTGDLVFPSVACLVQKEINADNAFCFDISAACSGFIYAISIAEKFISSGDIKKILVIGADKMSDIVDWKDRKTCILFGDGAGCAIVEQAGIEEKSKIIEIDLYSEGKNAEILKTTGGISTTQKNGFVQMDGQKVFKNAVQNFVKSTQSILSSQNLTTKDIDLVIPHQANKRIIKSAATQLKIDESRIVVSIENHGNTSAASIPLAMDQAISQGKLKKGDLVLLQSIGAGLTWGVCLLRF